MTSRRQPWLSWLLVLPLLFFAVGGEFSFQLGGRNAEGGTSLGAVADTGVPGERLGLALTYGIILILLLGRAQAVQKLALRSKALLGLAFFCMASVCWSQQPAVTAPRSFYFLLDTCFALFLLSRFSGDQLRRAFMLTGLVAAAASLLMAAVFPRFGLVHHAAHAGALQGIFAEKNMAGKVLVFLLTPAIHFHERWTVRRLSYCSLLLGTIGLTQSRTAWAMAALYLLFLCFLRFLSKHDRRSQRVLTAASLIAAGSILIAGFTGAPVILNLLGRDATLTGRTEIWTLLLQSVGKRPLLGYGYAGFWTGLTGESGFVQMSMRWVFSYAHNGYLEVLLQLGYAGLFLLGVLFVRAVRHAAACFAHAASPAVHWYAGLLFLTVLYNFDEETLLFPHQLTSLLFLIACGGLALEARDARTRSTAAFFPCSLPQSA